MSTKRFVLAAVVGGIVVFVAGGVLYGTLLVSFFEANQGSAMHVMREQPDWVHLAIGQLVFGVFLAVVIGKWAGVAGATAGLKIGAVTGLLLGLAIDLTMFGTTNISNINATLVDPFVMAVQLGIGGAAVGWMLGKVK